MRNFFYCIVFLFVAIISSCTGSGSDQPIKISIQPFTDISKADVEYVYAELKKVYPNIEIKRSIDLPSSAFYSARNRYRADSIIHYLKRNTPKGYVTIGLTTKDISTTKNGVKDWGVMGLGYRPGRSCVASSFRLANDQKRTQLFKVAVHEIGHTQNLPHCSVKTCFMRDAEGGNPTNEEKEFCTDCKAHLIDRGWQLQ